MNPDIQKAFHEAVSNNDVETARRMIAAGADVNAQMEKLLPSGSIYTTYPIFQVYEDSDIPLLQLLVEAGADVNKRDKVGMTPLFDCDFSCHKLVRAFIEAGAEVNIRNNENDTPLMYAAMNGCAESVKHLIEAGAHVNVHGDESYETPYDLARFEAANMDNEDAPGIMEVLLASGAIKNLILDIEDYPEISPLNYDFLHAVQHQDIARVKTTIAAGADINTVDRFGTSAIEQAAVFGNKEICHLLLDSGCSTELRLNAITEIVYDDVDTFHILLDCSDESVVKRGEVIAIHQAATYGLPNTMRYLLEREISPDTINDKGFTPLMTIARHCRCKALEMLTLLIEAGADINAVDEKGWTAAAHAAHGGWAKGLKLLLNEGASEFLNIEGKQIHLLEFSSPFHFTEIKAVFEN